jgi:hypothetical protein
MSLMIEMSFADSVKFEAAVVADELMNEIRSYFIWLR